MSRSSAVLLAGVAAMLGACTVVRVGEGASARVRYYPGIAVVSFDRADRVEVASVRTLGLGISRSVLGVGWVSTDVALVPPGRCELIFWKPSANAAREISELLSSADPCLVEKGLTK